MSTHHRSSPRPPQTDSRHLCGERAEAWAAEQLRARGWEILALDWRSPFAQVDIVGLSPCGEWRALLEVKARHPLSPARRNDVLRPGQLRRLHRAALALQADQPGVPVRVDLILVEWLRDGAWSLEHFEDLDQFE